MVLIRFTIDLFLFDSIFLSLNVYQNKLNRYHSVNLLDRMISTYSIMLFNLTDIEYLLNYEQKK
jgi:hypothetical protein